MKSLYNFLNEAKKPKFWNSISVDDVNEDSMKYKAFKSKYFATPPRWANFVAQDEDGKWFYYEIRPKVTSSGMESTGKKLDMDFQGDPKTWNQKPHSFFVANGRVTEGKLNEA